MSLGVRLEYLAPQVVLIGSRHPCLRRRVSPPLHYTICDIALDIAKTIFPPAIRTALARREAQVALRAGAARDRGNHQHLIPIFERILLIAQKTDVFIVHIEVNEPPHLSIAVTQMLLKRRKADLDLLNQLRQVGGLRLDL